MTDKISLRKTKIVVTVGPACSSPEKLREMIQAGVDIFRINFSHAKPQATLPVLHTIRETAADLGRTVGILGDLRGPRIRVGEMENDSILLEKGSMLRLDPACVLGTPERVGISFPTLAADVEEGALILLDDGNLELRVRALEAEGVMLCEVVRGGKLSSRRGINLPGRRVNCPSITEKDVEDIDFAVEQGFDFLALSFVQSAEDVRLLKQMLDDRGSQIPVISKVEKKSALDEIEAVVRQSDGVMVARGDLALEMSLQEVPIAQKRIIDVCRQNGVPVITATQMLESMTYNHKPTRAEAADVANAILDGTDAVMLSGESAIGKYPVETVSIMARIAERTEAAWNSGELPLPDEIYLGDGVEQVIALTSHVASRSLKVAAIVTYTTTGRTPRLVASQRPLMPVLALSHSREACRRMTLIWGVIPLFVEAIRGTAHLVEASCREAVAHAGARTGDLITVTSGTPYGIPGNTNLMKIERIP